MSKIIIMISGWMRSGKDTVGNHLCERFGFNRFAFADVLKDEVSEKWQIARSSLDTQEGKSVIIETEDGQWKAVREILITYGEQCRKANINHWVEKVIQSIDETRCQNCVITDWRFPNEHHVLKESMSKRFNTVIYTWRINRWDAPPFSDPTELALDAFPFDSCIENRNDVNHLLQKIDRLMDDLDHK
jgi:dephospho-CoA kinase